MSHVEELDLAEELDRAFQAHVTRAFYHLERAAILAEWAYGSWDWDTLRDMDPEHPIAAVGGAMCDLESVRCEYDALDYELLRELEGRARRD